MLVRLRSGQEERLRKELKKILAGWKWEKEAGMRGGNKEGTRKIVCVLKEFQLRAAAFMTKRCDYKLSLISVKTERLSFPPSQLFPFLRSGRATAFRQAFLKAVKRDFKP